MKAFRVVAVAMAICWPALASAGSDNSGGEGPKPEQPPWGRPSEGLRMSLRSAQTAYAAGDKIEVQMVIRNVHTEELEVVDTYPLRYFKFIVKAPDGKVLPLNKRGRQIRSASEAGMVDGNTLKPTEEASYSLDNFSRIYDLQTPGEYQITASIDVNQLKDPKKWSTLTSNTLKLTITEAEEKKDE